MATKSKTTKSSRGKKPMRDLKTSKDVKGGGRRMTNRGGGTQQNRMSPGEDGPIEDRTRGYVRAR